MKPQNSTQVIRPDMSNSKSINTKRIVAQYCVFLFAAWIISWLLMLKTPLSNLQPIWKSIYWIMMKFCIWILPVLLIVKFQYKKDWVTYLKLTNIRKGVLWGLVIGGIFVGIASIVSYFKKSFFLPSIGVDFISIILFAPLFEEITFRGFILEGLISSATVRDTPASTKPGANSDLNSKSYLQTYLDYWQANAITALLFLAIHIPGWYFMNELFSMAQISTAASIFLIGIIAGYVRQNSNSTISSIIFHSVNNLFSTFVLP